MRRQWWPKRSVMAGFDEAAAAADAERLKLRARAIMRRWWDRLGMPHHAMAEDRVWRAAMIGR